MIGDNGYAQYNNCSLLAFSSNRIADTTGISFGM